MIDDVFATCDRFLDEGVAPGGVIALWPADSAEPVTHAHGTFAGPGSEPIEPEQIYDIASITKLFTTALLVRLHEQGKLSIDELCAQYLPTFHGSELRLVDLLTHHVAFDMPSLAGFAATFADSSSLRTALLQLPVPRAAAATIHYSNLQFFYLGVIAEQITGKSLADLMHGLCRDLGLQHTYTGVDIAARHLLTPPTEQVAGHIIQGVTHDESARKLGGLAGYAGVFTNASDLARFGKAWLDGRIISRKLAEQIVFRDYDTSGEAPQALGWWLRMTGVDDIIRTPGVYVHVGFTGPTLMIDPTTNKVAACVCNRTYYGRGGVEQRVMRQALVTWVAS